MKKMEEKESRENEKRGGHRKRREEGKTDR